MVPPGAVSGCAVLRGAVEQAVSASIARSKNLFMVILIFHSGTLTACYG
jgi:hypothetical protein